MPDLHVLQKMNHFAQFPNLSPPLLIEPVLRYFDQKVQDPAVRPMILQFIGEATQSEDHSKRTELLRSASPFWLGQLECAYFQVFPNLPYGDKHADWLVTKCKYLLSVLQITRDFDPVIQHLLNYDYFAAEAGSTQSTDSAEFLVGVFELRGIDFFLHHWMASPVSGVQDDSLFWGAEAVVQALDFCERHAEAQQIKEDVAAKRNLARKITLTFEPVEYDPSGNLERRLRVASEKFWTGYLSISTWKGLTTDSRVELVDAFITEYLLKSQVLTDWANVSLLLCKVIEREVARVLFLPWVKTFRASSWNAPKCLPAKLKKPVQIRIQTLSLLKDTSNRVSMSPTLGQLAFIAQFWKDELMDSVSNTFIDVRKQASRILPDADTYVENLCDTLLEPIVDGLANTRISHIRNSAAHPQADADLDWILFSTELRELLGQPPKELLRLLCVNMAPLSHHLSSQAEQDGAGQPATRSESK